MIFGVFLLFLICFGRISTQSNCPIGFTWACDEEDVDENGKLCSCKRIVESCPSGYSQAILSCASKYMRKCIFIDNLECCQCVFDESGSFLRKSEGCKSGYSAGMSSTDCDTFDDYHVIFECNGVSKGGDRCCTCKLFPGASGGIVEEVEECSEGYSKQIDMCPMILGLQTIVDCENEICCRCVIPEDKKRFTCPEGTISKEIFDPYSCGMLSIECVEEGKCCRCKPRSTISRTKQNSASTADKEEVIQKEDSTRMKERRKEQIVTKRSYQDKDRLTQEKEEEGGLANGRRTRVRDFSTTSRRSGEIENERKRIRPRRRR